MNSQQLEEMREYKTQEHIKEAINALYKAQLKNKDNDFLSRKIEIALEALESTQEF